MHGVVVKPDAGPGQRETGWLWNPRRKGSRGRFKRRRIVSPKRFARGSFRTIRRGGRSIVVGCPKGSYDRKRKRCKVGMRAQAVLTPKRANKSRRRIKRRPSPAQLRARRAFVKMVRERAAARRRLRKAHSSKRSRSIRANPPSKGGHMARKKGRRRIRSHKKHRATRVRRHRSTRRRVRSHRSRSKKSRVNRRPYRRVRARRRQRHVATNPATHRRVRRHRRKIRSNPLTGGVKKIVRYAVALGVGVGLLYVSNWGLQKIDYLAANPKIMYGVQVGIGVAAALATKMYFKSWLLAALVGGPLIVMQGWKLVQEFRGGALAAPSGPAAGIPPTSKGVGDYVDEHEALRLPSGSTVMDPTTGEEFTVGDDQVTVGADDPVVGGFPLALAPSTQGVGGFPLALTQ